MAFTKVTRTTHDMNEAAKIRRVFDLITFLFIKPRTFEECAKFLDSSTRTIYRYVKLLQDVGYQINKEYEPLVTIQIVSLDFIQKKMMEVVDSREVQKTAEENTDLGVKPQDSDSDAIETLLRSPFLRKKPFVIALYGEYNKKTAVLFAIRLKKYATRKPNGKTIRRSGFNATQKAKIRAVLQNILTNLEMTLL